MIFESDICTSFNTAIYHLEPALEGESTCRPAGAPCLCPQGILHSWGDVGGIVMGSFSELWQWTCSQLKRKYRFGPWGDLKSHYQQRPCPLLSWLGTSNPQPPAQRQVGSLPTHGRVYCLERQHVMCTCRVFKVWRQRVLEQEVWFGLWSLAGCQAGSPKELNACRGSCHKRQMLSSSFCSVPSVVSSIQRECR